jgi:hypothetical protein
MKHDTTIALFLYWNRLRSGRPAPQRTEIEPADIRSSLADTFILEALPNGAARFRLAGTRLCAMFCRELKGSDFSSILSGRDNTLLARLVQSAIQDNSVSVVSLEGISRTGRRCGFELLLLPLAADAQGARLLGCMPATERPFWLGIDPITECEIASVRVIDPEREPLFLKNRPEIPVPPLVPDHIGEPPSKTVSVFDDTVVRLRDRSPSRRVAHLRVFDGGRDGGTDPAA